jgi:hypothetical protein
MAAAEFKVPAVREAMNLPKEIGMSDHNGPVYSTAEWMDYPEHEKTYKSFVKGGTIFASTAATVIALMAVFLT